MHRTTTARGALAALGIMAAVTILLAQESQPPPPRGEAEQPPGRRLPRPIVNTHQLMSLLNEPLYEYTREAMAGEPADAHGWETIEQRGLQAAEIANLVAIRNRAEKWQLLTAEFQDAALGLAESAKSRNWQSTLRAYQGLIDSCNNCHRTMSPDHAPQLKP